MKRLYAWLLCAVLFACCIVPSGAHAATKAYYTKTARVFHLSRNCQKLVNQIVYVKDDVNTLARSGYSKCTTCSSWYVVPTAKPRATSVPVAEKEESGAVISEATFKTIVSLLAGIILFAIICAGWSSASDRKAQRQREEAERCEKDRTFSALFAENSKRPVNYVKYYTNSRRLLNICSELIDKYEDRDTCMSCKEDLLAALKKRFDRSKAEISEWKDSDTDYIHIAHNQLHMEAADLLCSGRYHMIYGFISSATCAKNLARVFDRSLDWFEARGELSAEERQQYAEVLRYNITHTG